MIKFDTTKAEMEIIRKITKRAAALAKKNGIRYSGIDIDMDVTATHANDNPLDLEKLLKADDFNFAHDVFGIRAHLDRTTGKLGDCFLPRCTSYAAASNG